MHIVQIVYSLDRSISQYCVCTDESKVHLIKSNFRTLYAVPSRAVPHLGRTWIYLEGQNSTIRESFKKILMPFVKRVVQYSEKNAMSKIEISDNALRKYCPPETEVKQQIEDAAIKFATNHYKKKGFNVKSVEKENLGWDLTVIAKNNIELHVEVKGTSRNYFHFFLSKKEHKKMKNDPRWILFVVKNVLKNPTPKIIWGAEVENYFKLEPFCTEGTWKK